MKALCSTHQKIWKTRTQKRPTSVSDLHPEKHLPVIWLELQKIDTSCCALSYMLVFHIIGKYNQILYIIFTGIN